jgi:hypothetical protein
MSLFDDASLVLTPNGYKASKLYSIKPTSGLGDMTVVRATTATRVDSAGLIQSVAINVPRLDYTGGGCPSILVEPARTNSVLYSEQFDNAYWLKTNITITANATTAPDGTFTADKLTITTTLGIHQINRLSVVASSQCAMSIYAKADGVNTLTILDGTGNNGSVFNLSTVTVTNIGTGVGTIVSVGDGWYRCITIVTTTGFRLYCPNSSSSAGDGTSGIYIWGAQLEAGANATSYIPTTISALARAADVISKTGITNLIGQTQGTLYAEVNLDNFEVNNVRILAISDGTSANRIMLLTNSSNRITTIVSNSSVEQAQISSGTLTKGLYKIAVAYALNDFAFYINGALIGIDPSINVPICTDVYLGKIETSSQAAILNDRIKLAALFKTRLTEDQCKDLTT